jgi:hypothetical protein
LHKLLLFCWLFTFVLKADFIKFQEERYINALNTSVYKTGQLYIKKNLITLHYPNEKKTFIFKDDYIIEKNNNNEKIKTYEENLELSVFSKLIRSIYYNQTKPLEVYFEIKNQKGKTILLPFSYISNVIQKIEYEKIESELKFLKIHFTNQDWVNIVEVH